ncbi:MAG TPA: hypothetical protein VMH37_05680 [Candidatus Binataceae bacterium]|nr:hypothetical protein [Candidatus Binataceae bacterium]
MASQDENGSWVLSTVRLVVYLLIALAVGYAIVHFWSPYFGLNRH